MSGIKVVDLFPEPPAVAGRIYVTPARVFPTALEPQGQLADSAAVSVRDQAAAAVASPAGVNVAEVLLAPLGPTDLVCAALLGTAIYLGPDFVFAPAGFAANIRPGHTLESVVGAALQPDAQWLADRRETLASNAPSLVVAPIWAGCALLGLLAQRLLVVALEDSGFVLSVGVCACIGAALLETIREPLPTRAERDLAAVRQEEFLWFAAKRVAVGHEARQIGFCHETDVVRTYRTFYSKYRFADMSRASDGVSLADGTIKDLAREWNAAAGRPGDRSSAGYWKGLAVLCEDRTPEPLE